ncbi:MAG: DHA2 family efflux MFS transporter permease subunit [Bacillota bacterium]
MSQRWLILTAVVTGLALDLLDITVVNVAIPHLMAEFGTDIDTVQWVATAYLIAMGVVIPLSAFLADTYGTRRLFLVSMGLFTLGSFLCGLAWSFNALVLFRVLQGLGGGMIMPLGISIVYKTFPPPQRDMAMGIMGVPLLVAPALGPILGGYLVECATWRLIFYINLPVGLLAILLTVLVMGEFAICPRKTDYIGFLLVAPALGGLLWALSKAPSDGWNAPYVVLLLLFAGFSLTLFLLWEVSRTEPLVEVKLFCRPVYAAGVLAMTLAIMAIMGSLFLLPVFLQEIKGYGPLTTGVILLPEGLAAAVALPVAGFLVTRVGPGLLALTGTVMVTLATLSFTRLGLETPVSFLTPNLALLGFGMGLGIMPVMTAALEVVPPELNNQATSLLNMLRQVGSSFGIAIMATVAQTHQEMHYVRLAERLTYDYPLLSELVARLRWALAGTGDPSAMGAVVAAQLRLQAAVYALDDAFGPAVIFGILAVLGVTVLCCCRKMRTGVARKREVSSHDAHSPQTFAHL